jgi:hypothetical protein
VTRSIVFTLPGIEVYEAPGTVQLTVVEDGPQSGKVTDDKTYTLVKQNADFPITSFTVTPANLTDLGQSVTLSWTCSSTGANSPFGLKVYAQGPPPSGAVWTTRPTMSPLNDCVSDGICYAAVDGLKGVVVQNVDRPTTFELDVIGLNPHGERVITDSVYATVDLTVPSISDLSRVDLSPSGRFALMRWVVFNSDHITVRLDNTVIDDNAPPDTYDDGYLVPLVGAPATHVLAMDAYADPGSSARAHQEYSDLQVIRLKNLELGKDPNPVATAFTPDCSLALVCNRADRTVAVLEIDWDGDVPTVQLVQQIGVSVTPNAVAITPDGAHAFVGGDAGVAVLDIASRTVEPAVIAVPGAAAIAITPDGQYAVVPSNQDNQVYLVDVATPAVEPTAIPLPGIPTPVALTPNGQLALVTTYTTSEDNTEYPGLVTVVDLAQRRAEPNTIPVGGLPSDVAITPDGALALIAHQFATDIIDDQPTNDVSVVNSAGRRTESPIDVGAGATGVAIILGGSHVLVSTTSEQLCLVDVGARTSRVIEDRSGQGGRWDCVGVPPPSGPPRGLLALAGNTGNGTVAVI